MAGPCLTARLQGGSCVTPPVAAAESHRASLSFPRDNGKTGPIAVSSTSRHTCPSSCPLAGDQWPDPTDSLRIDQALLLQLARATRHLRAAWSFTHFPMGPENQAAVRQAAARGLVVNASTESRSIAAGLQRQGLPAVCVVPSDAPAVFRHEGVRFVAFGDRFGIPLCAQADRPFVITFTAHGPRAAAAAAHCS